MDKFWINDPAILFKKNNFYQIIPTSQMSLSEKLNSLTRLFIYLGILLLLITCDASYLLISIIAIILIILYYYYRVNNIKNEKFNQKKKPSDSVIKVNDVISSMKSPKSPKSPEKDDDVLDTESTKSTSLSDFAHWALSPKATCKEDQTQCFPYEDLRYNRENLSMENPNINF